MADLSTLTLLRNDPESAHELLQQAEKGDVDAQYAAGLIYAEGRGVKPDPALSYFWLTLACEQGDADADTLRMVVAADMTDDEYQKATALLDKFRNGQWHLQDTVTRQ